MHILLSLLLFLSTSLSSCQAQTQADRIKISIPSIQQEATSIWRTIRDIQFFEKAGYSVKLPQDPVIDSLLVKSRNGKFRNDDFSPIYNLLESKVYDAKDYQAAIGKVKAEKAQLNTFIQQIESAKTSWDWDFKLFDQYEVVFTLYGSGGSYDPDAGTVILFTTPLGQFKNYKSPANTIIHEIAHMGMEYSLVQKWKLSHTFKERMVDNFVWAMFREALPGYKIQNMGDTQIDPYLKSQEDIGKLNAVLEKILE